MIEWFFGWQAPWWHVMFGFVLACGLIIGTLFAIVAVIDNATVTFGTATVVEKVFKPSTLSTSAAPVVGSNGGVGVAVVTTGRSEEWLLILKDDSGHHFSCATDADDYYKLKAGDTVKTRISAISRKAWKP